MQFSFFDKKQETLIDHDGIVEYYPQFFDASEELFQRINAEVKFTQNSIRMWGKELPLPRVESWIGDKAYTYSGLTLKPHPWTSSIYLIKEQIEKYLSQDFNSCLVNLYRTGEDYVGPHADDEKELGSEPFIASVSLGASRRFVMKHRYEKDRQCEVFLQSGDLLVMKGAFQHFWLHSLPKMKKEMNPRINLTFRTIY